MLSQFGRQVQDDVRTLRPKRQSGAVTGGRDHGAREDRGLLQAPKQLDVDLKRLTDALDLHRGRPSPHGGDDVGNPGEERLRAHLAQLSKTRNRVAIRVVVGVIEQRHEASLDLLAHHVFPPAGLFVNVCPIEAYHVDEQALGKAVLAHHVHGPLVTKLGELKVTVVGDDYQAVALHPGNGLRHSRARVAQPLGDASAQRNNALFEQFVDRLEVHLGGVNEVAHAGKPFLAVSRSMPGPCAVSSGPLYCLPARYCPSMHRSVTWQAWPVTWETGPMPAEASHLVIPPALLPRDGRFGSGPSKVRPAQMEMLSALGEGVMGTSHRQAPVRSLVGRVRSGIAQLLGAPEGYEVLLGNGGSTSFWDAATFSLVRERAQHAVFGEFTNKFSEATNSAPFLAPSQIVSATPGTLATVSAVDDVDVYAWAHNETSTGVVSPVLRPAGAGTDQLTLVDATSIAGATAVDLTQADVYYFAPQKVFGSDGGLWLAVCSPAAIARIEQIAASDRWIPESLSLAQAVTNSRLDQTLNTPAIATLALLAEQLDWFAENGGLGWTAARSKANSDHVYAWANEREWATAFVADPAHRSPVVATIDLDASIDHTQVLAALRANGVLDAFPYRKLGRNQLRMGLFPAVDLADVQALTACVDYVVEQLWG